MAGGRLACTTKRTLRVELQTSNFELERELGSIYIGESVFEIASIPDPSEWCHSPPRLAGVGDPYVGPTTAKLERGAYRSSITRSPSGPGKIREGVRGRIWQTVRGRPHTLCVPVGHGQDLGTILSFSFRLFAFSSKDAFGRCHTLPIRGIVGVGAGLV